MGIEIERTFLLNKPGDDNWLKHTNALIEIKQGYIAQGYGNTVRVREAITRDPGTMETSEISRRVGIKGKPKGIVTPEIEARVTKMQFNHLYELCESRVIDKTRYIVPIAKHVFEIDVYKGVLAGLVTIDIELAAADEAIVMPSWIGEEITGRKEYTNHDLALKGLPQHFVTWWTS
ncbi:MAG: adenylate cyclase [Patescibacteria group bacterium]